MHEALREALVNTLIHADFTGRVSVLVVKRPDMFGFRNPGLMRIPIAQAVAGGTSDCRNRRLQTMFQLVGYGDHAGSGLPKIYHNWAGQHWRRPVLYELGEPEQTLMELRMTSLLPAEAVAELEAHLGQKFRTLPELERLALVTSATEGMVNHPRLREISTVHPADITKMLARLVKDSLLAADGVGRGRVYFLPWIVPPPQGAAFAAERQADLFEAGTLPQELGALPLERKRLPMELSRLPIELDGLPPELDRLMITELTQLSGAKIEGLRNLAQPVSEHPRVSPETMRRVVLSLCEGHYLGLRLLAELLNRKNVNDLRVRVLNPLVKEAALRRAFPRPNDPRQAYTNNQPAATATQENQS